MLSPTLQAYVPAMRSKGRWATRLRREYWPTRRIHFQVAITRLIGLILNPRERDRRYLVGLANLINRFFIERLI